MSSLSDMPRWVMGVIAAGALALLVLGYCVVSGMQKPPPPTAAEIQKTQAAERPGDPPSGGKSQQQPNQSAN